MKREQIIEMAKSSGFAKPSVSIDLNGKARTVLVFRAEKLEAFVQLVAAAALAGESQG